MATLALVVVAVTACGGGGNDDPGSSSSTTSPPAAPDERLTALDPCALLTPEERVLIITNFDPPDFPAQPPDVRTSDPPVEDPGDHDRACRVEVRLKYIVGFSVAISVYPTMPSAEITSVRREDQEALDDDAVHAEDVVIGGRQAEVVAYAGGQIVAGAGYCAVRFPTSATSTVEVYGSSLSSGLDTCDDVRAVAELLVDVVPAYAD